MLGKNNVYITNIQTNISNEDDKLKELEFNFKYNRKV